MHHHLSLTWEQTETFDLLFQDIDNSAMVSALTSIELCESIPVLLALCSASHEYRYDAKWRSAGRHAANRISTLFGPPIT